jgi:hypothetical protein
MVEFASNTVIEDFLSLDEFFPDVVEFLFIPHFIVKEILIIDQLYQFSNNLQPLNITQIQLNLPKKNLSNPTILHIIRLLEPITRLQPFIQYSNLIMQSIKFLNLIVIRLEDLLVL